MSGVTNFLVSFHNIYMAVAVAVAVAGRGEVIYCNCWFSFLRFWGKSPGCLCCAEEEEVLQLA